MKQGKLKTIIQHLTDVNLISPDNKSIESYSSQKLPGSRLDVRRAINRQPCWLSQMKGDSSKKVKIILNFYQLLFNPNYTDCKLVTFLLDKGFQIYCRTSHDVLKEIHSSDELLSNEIEVVPNALIEDELSSNQQEVSDYLIMDHVIRASVINELKDYIGETKLVSEPYALKLSESEYPLLDKEKIKALGLIAKENRFSTIRCNIKGNINYTITWNNTFTSEQFESFLTSLHEGAIDKLFSSTNNEKIEELIIVSNDKDIIINLSAFEFLKKLHITCTGRPQKILGIEALSGLEELNIRFVFNDSGDHDIKINVVECKQLKDLSVFKTECNCLNGCSHIDIIGLKNATHLNKLKVDGRVKLDGESIQNKEFFDASSLTELRSLTLNNCVFFLSNHSSLPALENLTLEYSNLPATVLGNLKALRSLNLTKTSVIENFPGLEQCTLLEELTINSINWLGLLNLETFENLRFLELTNLFSNTNPNIAGCKSLEHLVLDVYTQNGPFILNLQALEKLLLLDIKSVDITGLEACKSLRDLSLRKTNLSVFDQNNHEELIALTIGDCEKIKIIPSMKENKLEFITINSCSELILPSEMITPNTHSVKTSWIKELVSNIDKTPSLSYDNSSISSHTFLSAPPICFESTTKASRITCIPFDTYVPPGTLVTVQRSIYPSFEGQKAPPLVQERKIIYDKIAIDESKNIIFSEIDINPHKLTHTFMRNYTGKKENVYIGLIETNPKVKGKYFLTDLSENDTLIDISDKKHWAIYYAKKTGQYLIEWTADLAMMPHAVHYLIETSSSVQKSLGDISSEELPKLPSVIKKVIASSDIIKAFSSLNKLSTLNSILGFCSGFKNEKLTVPEDYDEKDVGQRFALLLTQGKGTAQHRALIFTALCHYFNIAAQVVSGNNYCRVRVKNRSNRWLTFDLGSPEVIVKETISPYFNRAFMLREKDVEQSYLERYEDDFKYVSDYATSYPEDYSREIPKGFFEKRQPDTQEQQKRHWEKQFTNQNSWVLKCRTTDEFLDGLMHQNQPLLLRIPFKEYAWDWYDLIFNRSDKDAIVYIHHPYELRSLAELVKITNKDRETTVDGPLNKLIKRGVGILLINWSNFSPNERAIYKCMMDEPATLHDKLLPKGIKVIGLVAEQIVLNDVFLTRCNVITLPEHLKRPKRASRELFREEVNPEPCSLVIDIYGSAQWYKFLIEDLNIKGLRMNITAGELVRALELDLPLVLKNPPLHDPSFLEFMHRLTIEKSFYFNGKRINIPRHFKLGYQKNASQLIIPNNVIFDEEKRNGKTYDLSMETYYQLFDLQTIKSDNLIYTLPGWIDDYTESDQFIVEDKLTHDQWLRLFNALTLNMTRQEKIFHFYVSPSADPRNQKQSEKTEQTQPREAANFSWLDYGVQETSANKNIRIESSDPLFVAHQLSQTLGLNLKDIFHIPHENAWLTLIEKVTLIREDNQFKAAIKESDFWKKLKAGQTLLLCGNMPEIEQNSLKYLFTDKPYLYVNGVREEIKGRLIWIMESNSKLSNQADYIFNPTVNDYKQALGYEPTEKVDEFLNAFKTEFPELHITFEKYKACADALTNGNTSRLFSSLLNYVDTHTKGYARLKQFVSEDSSKYEENSNQLVKQTIHLGITLLDDEEPIIYLMGEPVTGKTEVACAVAKCLGQLFIGEGQILNWLTAPVSENKLTLLLDDINLENPAKWAFLEGMVNGLIHYEGRSYPLTPQHKVIATSEHSPYKHPALWAHAYLISFKPFEKSFIREKIQQTLQDYFKPAEIEEIQQDMISIYDYLHEIVNVSIREIEHCCWRLTLSAQSTSLKELVAKTLFEEMAGLLIDGGARQQFKQVLQKTISPWTNTIPTHLPKDRALVIPPQKFEAWNLIINAFLLRQQRINLKSNLNGKLGTLLEGPSGIGKSTCWLKAAELMGLSRDAVNGQLRYYHFTPSGSERDKVLLLEGFHAGSVFIIDELNLNADIRALIAQLLSGKDFSGNEARQPGFTVLASQNPAKYAGCQLVSQKLINLFHKISIENYQPQELFYIAKTLKHPEPALLVNSFETVRKKFPALNLNARSLFKVMIKKLPEKQPEVKYSAYPCFLSEMKVPQKKVSPASVAHSLWLFNKDSKTTEEAKSAFAIWSKERKLPFGMKEVEEELSQYVMKR